MLRRYDRFGHIFLGAGLVAAIAGLVGVLLDAATVVGVVAIGFLSMLVLAVVELRRKVGLEHDATRFQIGQSVREVTASMQLAQLVTASAPLPPMGDWALQPSALITLYHLVREHRPGLVVELGSGSSTVILGHAVKSYGGRIVSLEHDEQFADATREMIAAHHLSETCTIRVAPLTDALVGDEVRRWYAQDAVWDLDDIGMLLVDGPPEVTWPEARFPALPLLRNRLAAGAFIVLDDANRSDERRILAAWDAMFPDLAPVRVIAPRIAVRRIDPT